ncbi:CASD1, partial [Cordylochernes scorpioides]
MADDVKRTATGSVEFIRHINARNAKLIAVVIVISFIVYHSIIHMVYDEAFSEGTSGSYQELRIVLSSDLRVMESVSPAMTVLRNLTRIILCLGIDTCKWMLNDGRYQGYHVWQPYGCMMHTYSTSDARMCMRYIAYWGGTNRLVFIGDSRIRQLYEAFVSTLSPKFSIDKSARHQDHSYRDPDLKLDAMFLWQPLVDNQMASIYNRWLEEEPRPTVVVTGSGPWAIKTRNGSRLALEEFSRNLSHIVPLMERLQAAAEPRPRILWVLQSPVVSDRLQPDRAMLTNEQIDLYNSAALSLLKYSSVMVWKSVRLLSQGNLQEMEDGLHLGKNTLHYSVQILLNKYCNDHMNYNDGTCCSSSEPLTTLQIITFSAFGELVASLAKLGLIMGYFFLCDRTNFFMKENKYYTHLNFFLPLAYVFVLGLFFTEESQCTQVLHRDQTNEWKGWMQLVILIYHMTGASQILPIYMHIRVLVTAYLFLTGYGHFTYFWHAGEHTLVRFCQVLFRLNLLVVVLCLCMNRPYQFYYFVPLVSFWFLVVYATMAAIPHVSSALADANHLHYLYMVLKFVGLLSIITVLYMSEVFFEKIFVTRPWKALFVTTDDSIKEWWFRWKIDRY